MRRILAIAAVLVGLLALGIARQASTTPQVQAAAPATAELDRSPVDLVLTLDEQYAITANQSSDSASLVRLDTEKVIAEVPCGRRPAGIAISPSGRQVLVTGSQSGDLTVLAYDNGTLQSNGVIVVGADPRGVAISPDGKLAYVALAAAAEVAVVDLAGQKVVDRIAVQRWPRHLTLTPDGSRLAVGCSGDGGITVVDTATRKKLFDTNFRGLNIGHLVASADGKYAYFPWMMYADRPISAGNIREGWVLGNRLARVRLDEEHRREAIALDPRGKAVADPTGIALTADQQWLLSTAAGSHELVVYRLSDLPLRDDGPGDHLDPNLRDDADRFYRISLGGRPLGVRVTKDGRAVIANALLNTVQVVDLGERRLSQTIELGGPHEPSLARRGEEIFYDAGRSVDQWYSCSSCHFEGGANAGTMDTNNDGSTGTYKTVLSLRNVTKTGPWFWHGWQKDLKVAVRKSMTDSMQGPPPKDEDVEALLTFLNQLPPVINSNRQSDGKLTAAAERGKAVFNSSDAACATCHSGPYFTDGQIHDVGLNSSYDYYQGYNTPSLLGTFDRVRYLHHGRATTLEEVLTEFHSPAKVSSTRDLTAEELADLVAYVKSL